MDLNAVPQSTRPLRRSHNPELAAVRFPLVAFGMIMGDARRASRL